MPQEKQEKKKCDKARKSGSLYRQFKAKQLRAEADMLKLKAKNVLAEAERVAKKRGVTAARKAEIRNKAYKTAVGLNNKANDLTAKAIRLTSGYKRHHHKPSALARIREKHAAQGDGWDILAPNKEQTYPSLRRAPLASIVKVVTVTGYGVHRDVHGHDRGYEEAVPIMGVAWNERVRNEPVPDAPRSGVYQMI